MLHNHSVWERRRSVVWWSSLFQSFLVLSASCAAARGDKLSWQVPAGNWSIASNWGGTVPTGSDTAYIANGGTATITTSTPTCGTLAMGDVAGSGSVQMTAGSLGISSSGAELIGYSGLGAFVQLGGTNYLPLGFGSVYLGFNVGSSGIYSLGGTAQLECGTMYVGYSGTGSFTQSRGASSPNSIYLGFNAGSFGSYILSGQSGFYPNSEYVGFSGGGTFVQTGGDNWPTYLTIGSQGQYQFSGGNIQLSILTNQGVFDATSSTGTLTAAAGSFVDLSNATLVNTRSMTLSLGTKSLVLLPAGFNPVTELHSFSNSGVTYNVGTPLTILPGQSAVGASSSRLALNVWPAFSVSDFVDCGGTLSGGTINLNGGVMVSGSGNVQLGSGTLSVNDSPSGMTGGTLSASREYVGYSATGSFTQVGGLNWPEYIGIGYQAGSSGSYSLTGSGTLRALKVSVGVRGAGSLTQTGGTDSTDFLIVGGQYDLAAGYLAAGNEYIGAIFPGTFIQSGGTNCGWHAEYPAFYIGGSVTTSGGTIKTSGTYILTGTGLLNTGAQYVGYSGTGAFAQSGGTNSLAYPYFPSSIACLTIAQSSASVGTYNLTGSGEIYAEGEIIGYCGSGTFSQSGGTNTVGAKYALSLADQTGSIGIYNLTGGLLVLPWLDQGKGTALFNFSGGTLQANAKLSSSLSMTLGTDGGGATFDDGGFAVTLSGSLSGPGSLTKVGGGTLALTATNTYAGPTTINQGKLLVNGSLVSPVVVYSGGTLGGVGSLTSVTVNAGGGLAPGDAPGTLTLGGSLSLLSGAVMDYQLDTPLHSDMVFMPSGTLALNGQQFSDFNFAPLAGFGQGTYTLIDAGTISGSLGSSTTGTIDGLSATLAIQGDNLVLNVVPEPCTLSLFGAAALAVMGCTRPSKPRNTRGALARGSRERKQSSHG